MELRAQDTRTLTHGARGIEMILKGITKEARLIEEETGVPTITAGNGMQIEFGETLSAQASKKAQKGLNRFF